MAESELEKYREKILLLLCGLPGAGKTTFVRNILKDCPAILKEYEIRHVCFDDVFEGIADVFTSENWHESRQRCEKQTVEIMTAERNKPLLLILDDNFYYRSMRFTYFKLARKFGFSFISLVFRISKEEAIQRDAKRPVPVGADVINRMCQRIEFPDASQYRWDRSIESPDWKAILTEPPVPPLIQVDPSELEESRKKTASSVKHQVDLGLRKRVGSTMRMLKSKENVDLKKASKQINQTKAKILRSTAKGIVESSEDIDMEVERQLVAFQIEIDRMFSL